MRALDICLLACSCFRWKDIFNLLVIEIKVYTSRQGRKAVSLLYLWAARGRCFSAWCITCLLTIIAANLYPTHGSFKSSCDLTLSRNVFSRSESHATADHDHDATRPCKIFCRKDFFFEFDFCFFFSVKKLYTTNFFLRHCSTVFILF